MLNIANTTQHNSQLFKWHIRGGVSALAPLSTVYVQDQVKKAGRIAGQVCSHGGVFHMQVAHARS